MPRVINRLAGVAAAVSAILVALATSGSAEEAADLLEARRLGRLVFEDKALSEPAGVACASCHDPEHAFHGTNGSTVPGIAAGSRPGTFGKRNVPSIMYLAYSPRFGFRKDPDKPGKLEASGGQFWDGRADTLTDQITGPMLDANEMNNPSIEAIVAKVGRAPYAEAFRKLFGAQVFDDPKVAIRRIGDAVAAYEASSAFAPFSSKFDDYLRGTAELTAEEKLGFKLFSDKKKGNCIACHVGVEGSNDPTDWIFTDFTYDVLGTPRNPAIPVNREAGHYDLGLCEQPGLVARLPRSIKLKSLCGAFKVPTLRNVAIIGPYYHNSVFASLRDAVAFYATRDTDPGRWYPKDAKGRVLKYNDLPRAYWANVNTDEVPYDRKPGQKPRLDDREIDALVAFLKTLTDRAYLKP